MTIWIKIDLLSAFMCLCIEDAIALKGHSSLIVIASKEGRVAGREKQKRFTFIVYSLPFFGGGHPAQLVGS